MPHLDRRTVKLSAVAALSATALFLIFLQSATATQIKPQEHVVEIQDFQFAPNTLQVHPNDTIVWVNRDIVPHTATAKDKSWDTGVIKRGESSTVKITPGIATSYFCRFHPGMKATLEIIIKE